MPWAPWGYGLAGDITLMGWPSLPWPLLMFLGAGLDHVGSSESHSAAALVCSEGAQTEQSNRQTPGKYLLDDAFRENKCWHKSSLHSCFYLLWLTFAWDWCRCSHFSHSYSIPFLASQSVPITRGLSVQRSTRQPLGHEAFWEPAAPLAVLLPSSCGMEDRPFSELASTRRPLQSSNCFFFCTCDNPRSLCCNLSDSPQSVLNFFDFFFPSFLFFLLWFYFFSFHLLACCSLLACLVDL